MGEPFCDVCGERWGIPTPAHECKVVPPMRDTATLLELLEAEERHWTIERDKQRDAVAGHLWMRAYTQLCNLSALIHFYREEASRGTA